jgi:hypothetical protein
MGRSRAGGARAATDPACSSSVARRNSIPVLLA